MRNPPTSGIALKTPDGGSKEKSHRRSLLNLRELTIKKVGDLPTVRRTP